MSILIRNDGAVFLIQVYRDRLRHQKAARMREKLRHLSDQQGRYVQIFADKGGEVEVCLDKQVGFLLGETIINHFAEHASFIYLEQLKTAGKSLVVVVKDRKVQLDTLVDNESIGSELLPFVASDTDYCLFYAGYDGQLPIAFAGSVVDRIGPMLAQAVSLSPLLDALPLNPRLQLVPCEKAIQQSNFSAISSRIGWATGFIVFAILAIMLFIGLLRDDRHEQPTGQLRYAGYYNGIAKEPASQVLSVIMNTLSQVVQLPTLELDRLQYHQDQLELDFSARQAKLQPLLNWAKNRGFHFSLYAGNVKLTQKQQFKPADLHNRIYSTTAFYAYLSDHLREFHPGSNIRLSSSSRAAKQWQTLNCEWQVSDLTLADLDWLRRLLVNAPVTCDSIALSYHDGEMRGTIHLKIWGTQ